MRQPPSDDVIKQIEQALEEFEREGLVKWTGEYRDGQRVYALTEEGKRAAEANQELLKYSTPTRMREKK
jgi:DNA-binding PadR family transcriptional regulator